MSLRDEPPFVRFLARLGVVAKGRTEGGVLAMCPFHGDVGTPSLSVRDDGLFHCFSAACDVRGRSFVSLGIRAGLDWAEARTLVASYGLPAKAADAPAQPRRERPARVLTGRWGVDWHGARRLVEAGLPNPEPVVEAAATYMLLRRNVSAEALSSARVGVDRATGAIVFPQFEQDASGAEVCVGVSTRIPGTAKRYLTLFDVKGRAFLLPRDPADAVVLVEGQIDALRVRTAMAGMGTSTYSASVSDATIGMLRARKGGFVLFYDDDAAGVHATARLLAELGPWRCRVVTNYFGAKDPGDMTDAQILEAVRTARDGDAVASEGVLRSRLRVLRCA